MHEPVERGRRGERERSGQLLGDGVATDTAERGQARRDLAWLAALAGVLLVVFVTPTILSSWNFGVGPDVPVYLWWARVGASQGLSVIGERPGIAATIATAAGTLHLPLVPAIAGLQYALAASVGVAAVALLRGRTAGGRFPWLLAGLATGLFAAHLGGGYVANLAFTVPFFAAGTALAARTQRGTDAAAALLGGAGLAHPQFFLVGVIVLSIAALWSFLREPERGWASDAGRVTVAAAGAGAIVGAGLLSMLVGPAKLRVDTSKDAFLRRTGLESLLANTYRERFNENIRRYASWALLPLAAAGIPRVHGFTRRFLVAWALLTIVGVPIGIWSGWFPPDRIITFGFALPALAALGIAWADGFLEARVPLWIAWPATAALILLLAWPTLGAWARQQPFISPQDLASATEVGRIAATTPPGTPIVVIVNDIDDTAIFLATQAGNILRAAVPPERAGDVYIYVGDPARYFAGEPTLRGNAEYDALSSQLLDDIPAGDAAVFVLRSVRPGRRHRSRPALRPVVVRRGVHGPRSASAPARRRRTHRGGAVGDRGRHPARGGLPVGARIWLGAVDVRRRRDGGGRGARVRRGAPSRSSACSRNGSASPLTGSWGPTLISLVAGGLGYGLLVRKGVPPTEPAA